MNLVRVERRFQGPERSGNGGYVAGLVGTALAGKIGPDVVPKVTLRMPPPLEKELELTADADGARLRMGTAWWPRPCRSTATSWRTRRSTRSCRKRPGWRRRRTAGSRIIRFRRASCAGRPTRRGLQLKPGPVGDGRTACTWKPAADLARHDGLVDEIFLWSALDCPGGWTIDLEGRPSVLGQLTACIDARPQAGEECVALGRYLGEDGRKTFTASTLYDADGRVLARARHTWITVDPAAFN